MSEMRNAYRILVGILKQGNHFREVSADGRIILKLI
jgi:hypothetical protein